MVSEMVGSCYPPFLSCLFRDLYRAGGALTLIVRNC